MKRGKENRSRSLIVRIRPDATERNEFPACHLVMNPFWDDLIVVGKKKNKKRK